MKHIIDKKKRHCRVRQHIALRVCPYVRISLSHTYTNVLSGTPFFSFLFWCQVTHNGINPWKVMSTKIKWNQEPFCSFSSFSAFLIYSFLPSLTASFSASMSSPPLLPHSTLLSIFLPFRLLFFFADILNHQLLHSVHFIISWKEIRWLKSPSFSYYSSYEKLR